MQAENSENEATRLTMQRPYENDLKKSNLLIGAKYKATLSELKITYAGLYALQSGEYEDTPDGLIVRFNGAQLKTLLNVKGNHIYDVLDDVAKSMTNRNMGWSDPETKTFDYMAIVTRARYENSALSIHFNKGMKEYLLDLKSDFTTLNKITMMSFSSTYSFRLYELLKKQCFYPKMYKGERTNLFTITIGLSELKFDMGVANADAVEVKTSLMGVKNPDYDKALTRSREKIKSYAVWNNFKNRCLEKTIDEINAISDIFVKYEPIRKGRGGKVCAVEFTIQLKTEDHTENMCAPQSPENSEAIPVNDETVVESKVLTDNDKFPIWTEVAQILSAEGVQFTDVQAICEEAKYDVEKIRNAYEMMKTSKTKIEKVTGWLIACIRKEYSQPVSYTPSVKPEKKRSTKKNQFTDFNQREYDYDELERMLLNSEVPVEG